MKTRTITSVVILLIAIPILIFSEYIVYPIALGLFSLVGVYEIFRVVGVDKRWYISIPAYIIAAVLPLCTHEIFLGPDFARSNYILLTAAAVFAYLLYVLGAAVFSAGELTVTSAAEAFVAFTYVTVSFTSLSILRYMSNGLLYVFLVFIAAWGSDVAAYLVGSLIGKHKLIPKVSPKKTVEGAIGGIVAVTLLFVVYGLVIEAATDLEANFAALIFAGTVLAVVSQVGDLIASLIKREHNVKDYGSLMPGHGGIMDRFDSIIAVATPLVAICFVFPLFT